MIIGIFLMLLGGVFLLRNLGLIELPTSIWALIWPFLVIIVGLYMTLATHRGREWFSKITGHFKK